MIPTLWLLLLCGYSSLWAQTRDQEAYDRAFQEQQDARALYGTESIEYQAAALNLASLHLQEESNFTYPKWYGMAKEALLFVVRRYGNSDPVYDNFLSALPVEIAARLDAELEIMAADMADGPYSARSVQALFQLAQAKGMADREESYPDAVEAFARMDRLSPVEQDIVHDYAYGYLGLDSMVLLVASQKAALEQAWRQAPKALQTAQLLRNFAQITRQYEPVLQVSLYLDSAYLYSTRAMAIYEARGAEQPFKATYQAMPKAWQRFYDKERLFVQYLAERRTNQEVFRTFLKDFLVLVDEEGIPPYSSDDVLNRVEDSLAAQYPNDVRARQALERLRENWEFDEEERKVQHQENKVTTLLKTYGATNKQYLDEAVVLVKMYIDEVRDREAYDLFEQLLRDYVSVTEDPLSPAADSLFESYVTEVDYTWAWLFRLQRQETRYLLSGPSKRRLYWKTYFERALSHQLNDVLYDDLGVTPMAQGLYSVPDSLLSLVLPYVYRAIELDMETATTLEAMAEILPQRVPPTELRPQLEPLLTSTLSEDGSVNLEHMVVREALADAYWYHQALDPSYADSALAYYQTLAPYYYAHSNDKAYPRLLDKITHNTAEQDPWPRPVTGKFFERMDIYYRENPNKQGSKIIDFMKRYGDWHYRNYRYVEAEKYYTRLLQHYERLDAPALNLQQYDETQYHLARILRKSGRYARALEAYERLNHYSWRFKGLPISVQLADDLGLLWQQLGQPDKALEYFDLALQRLEELETVMGSRYEAYEVGLLYIKILRHKGDVQLENYNLQRARYFYQLAIDFEKNRRAPKGITLSKDVSLQAALARLEQLQYHDKKALRYYQQALKGMTDLEEKARTHLDLALYCDELDLDSAASYHLNTMIDLDLERIARNYTLLSEEERLVFFASLYKRLDAFLTYTVAHPDSALLVKALNAHLQVKGLSLETSIQLQNFCNKNQNPAMSGPCKEWGMLRDSLATLQDRTAALALQEEISNLERNIIYAPAYIQQDNRVMDFEKLQDQMYNFGMDTERAVAVEFIRVAELDNDDIPQLVYYAAVVGESSSTPQFVRLATEEEIADMLLVEVSAVPNNYISNDGESLYLYDLLWRPLEPYLDSAQAVHLSPTGIMTKIAFGTLRMSPSNSKRLMDRWELHYHNDFRELLDFEDDPGLEPTDYVLLVGDVQFAPLGPTNNRMNVTKGGFAPLPGTAQEVDVIWDLVLQKHYDGERLKEERATEDLVSRKVQNGNVGTILHLATHGYFFPSTTPHDGFSSSSNAEQPFIAHSVNPLLRSGLALAGINQVWSGDTIPPGREDGIWTALEVSNLKLSKTKLVVLSACETGRGDINNYEGVLGLRRAFKVAGARRLIVSLWKVPDLQTAELMAYFYQAYLEPGTSTQEALQYAQNKVRERYPNPYYWGAFLLIE